MMVFANDLLIKFIQFEAVASVVSGKDTFVVLPTGHGKSLIYAILPMVFDYLLGRQLRRLFYIQYVIHFKIGRQGSIVVVVTPLVVLMMDQKQRFLNKDITVEFVGEAQTDDHAVLEVISGKV